MEKIAIDMDEVIADSFGKMQELWAHETGEELKKDEHSLHAFYRDKRETLYGYPQQEGFFQDLKVIEGSREVLARLNQKYQLYIVSAATEFALSMNDKLAWLKQHFPFLSWQQVVFCGDKSIIDTHYLIDDHVKNLKGFKGKGYLFHAPHNIHESDFPRLKGWQEVATTFL